MKNILRNMTTLYIQSEGQFLMLYRIGSRVVAPSWCGIGGHFEKEELNDPKQCILRELEEEVGLTENDLTSLKLKYVTLRYKNDEIRQNYYFFADLCPYSVVTLQCTEGELHWVEREKLMSLEMPFTAKACVEHYLSIGCKNDSRFAGIATSEGVNFVELVDF